MRLRARRDSRNARRAGGRKLRESARVSPGRRWFYRDARAEHGVRYGRGGVTFVQRFGSAVISNLHAHPVVLDGVFAETSNGELRFHRASPPSDDEIAALLAVIRRRILRHLERHGFLTTIRLTRLATNRRCSRAATQPRLSTARRSANGPARVCTVFAIPTQRAPSTAHRCKPTSSASTCTPAYHRRSARARPHRAREAAALLRPPADRARPGSPALPAQLPCAS